MYINLDFNSKKPIYTQLKQQIIAGIARGDVLPGESLPSIRSLAADIGINLNTVNKTYQQLRQEGFILIHRQSGVVVNPHGTPKADKDYINKLTEKLHPLIAESICRGIKEEDFLYLCKQVFADYKKDGDQ